jgi:hypothetical protein
VDKPVARDSSLAEDHGDDKPVGQNRLRSYMHGYLLHAAIMGDKAFCNIPERFRDAIIRLWRLTVSV